LFISSIAFIFISPKTNLRSKLKSNKKRRKKKFLKKNNEKVAKFQMQMKQLETSFVLSANI
jgi:hypothetical protein